MAKHWTLCEYHDCLNLKDSQRARYCKEHQDVMKEAGKYNQVLRIILKMRVKHGDKNNTQ